MNAEALPVGALVLIARAIDQTSKTIKRHNAASAIVPKTSKFEAAATKRLFFCEVFHLSMRVLLQYLQQQHYSCPVCIVLLTTRPSYCESRMEKATSGHAHQQELCVTAHSTQHCCIVVIDLVIKFCRPCLCIPVHKHTYSCSITVVIAGFQLTGLINVVAWPTVVGEACR